MSCFRFEILPFKIHKLLATYLSSINDFINLSRAFPQLSYIYSPLTWRHCLVVSDLPPYTTNRTDKRLTPLSVFLNPTKYRWFLNHYVVSVEFKLPLNHFNTINTTVKNSAEFIPEVNYPLLKLVSLSYHERDQWQITDLTRFFSTFEDYYFELQISISLRNFKDRSVNFLLNLPAKNNLKFLHLDLDTKCCNFGMDTKRHSIFDLSDFINLETLVFKPEKGVSYSIHRDFISQISRIPRLKVLITSLVVFFSNSITEAWKTKSNSVNIHHNPTAQLLEMLSNFSLLQTNLHRCVVSVSSASYLNPKKAEYFNVKLPAITHFVSTIEDNAIAPVFECLEFGPKLEYLYLDHCAISPDYAETSYRLIPRTITTFKFSISPNNLLNGYLSMIDKCLPELKKLSIKIEKPFNNYISSDRITLPSSECQQNYSAMQPHQRVQHKFETPYPVFLSQLCEFLIKCNESNILDTIPHAYNSVQTPVEILGALFPQLNTHSLLAHSTEICNIILDPLANLQVWSKKPQDYSNRGKFAHGNDSSTNYKQYDFNGTTLEQTTIHILSFLECFVESCQRLRKLEYLSVDGFALWALSPRFRHYFLEGRCNLLHDDNIQDQAYSSQSGKQIPLNKESNIFRKKQTRLTGYKGVPLRLKQMKFTGTDVGLSFPLKATQTNYSISNLMFKSPILSGFPEEFFAISEFSPDPDFSKTFNQTGSFATIGAGTVVTENKIFNAKNCFLIWDYEAWTQNKITSYLITHETKLDSGLRSPDEKNPHLFRSTLQQYHIKKYPYSGICSGGSSQTISQKLQANTPLTLYADMNEGNSDKDGKLLANKLDNVYWNTCGNPNVLWRKHLALPPASSKSHCDTSIFSLPLFQTYKQVHDKNNIEFNTSNETCRNRLEKHFSEKILLDSSFNPFFTASQSLCNSLSLKTDCQNNSKLTLINLCKKLESEIIHDEQVESLIPGVKFDDLDIDCEDGWLV